jgi:hypothetical protein
MGKDEAHHSMKSLIIVVTLATAFSSLTLWLIESWIKYPLFLFEVLTIIILYLIVSGYDIKITMKQTRVENLNIGLIIDLFLMASALSLLTFNVLQIEGGLVQLALALLCTSLLSGYALLNIFGLTRHFSKLENLVLSYILSYAFTGFITLALLFASESTRVLGVLGSFILIGLISALKRKKQRALPTPKSLAKNIDSLGIIIALAFFALAFYFMYPGFALLPGTDISQHYASSVILWRTPDLYSGFNYVLAHLHESAFIAISNAPVTLVQTALVTLNFIMPLAFYAMAKSYLESVDARLPAVSTIFFSLFSGFAWIYLAQLKLDGVEQMGLSLLSLVNDKAYNGAVYLAQPFLWYVPLSVSFTIMIIQFMFLRKLDVGKKSFVAIFFLLTVASYMTHVTEAVIFSLFLVFYAFFSRNKTVRLNDALLASIIGFAFIDAFYTALQYILGINLGFSLAIPFIATAMLAIVYAYRTFKVQDKVIAVLPRLSGKFLVKLLVYIATFVYLLGLVAWVGGIPSFHTSMLVDVGAIPWFAYPVFLGVGGVLMMVSLHYLLEDHEAMRLLMPFLALVVFSLLFGRALTFINLNLFITGYWEKRFTSYFFLASAVIAPVAMIKVVDSLKRNQAKIKRTLLLATMVSIITVYGLQSFFVVTEYWAITTAPAYQISEGEFQAINYLSGILQQDKYAYTITLTSGSYNALTFATPPYQLSGMQVFRTAENPEVPFVCLKARNLSHAFLYMDSRDYALLNKTGQSWLANHLLPILPVLYRNNVVTIYNISSVSFPQTNSTTALIVPFDNSMDPTKPWLYAYDTLSLSKYDYTVAYDLDCRIFSYPTLVLSIDPPSQNIIEKNFQDNFSNENGWTPVSGTWQYAQNGLEAGKHGEYQDAIFLSPVSARNFTASLNFTPIDGDLKVANYVLLIYDWKDNANYKYAELMFDGTGEVYAYFSSYTNGQVAIYPAWPGLKTGLKWQLGDSFNLTVSVQGNDATLNINGSQYLSTKSDITGGQLGIRATRFYQVLFTGFKAVSSNDVQLRNVEEYLHYVEEGGKLVVLNTNGYGYFADQLLTRDNHAIDAYMINGSGNITLPANLTVSKLSPKAENVEAIAYYRSQKDSSVYAIKEKIGSGEIIYVNMYPIVEAIDQSNNKAGFYKILGELLKSTEVPLEPFTYVSEISDAFRQVEMSGNIQVDSSSLLFPLDVNLGKLEITSANNSVSSLVDVKGLRIFDYIGIHVEASNLTLSNGNGFYCALKFGGKIIITPEGNSTSMTASTADRNTTQFTNIKMITIENDLTTLYMRQPTINVRGLATFKELYSSGEIYQKTGTQGQDLRVNGNIKLTLYLSDTYSFASLLGASGSFERSPPILAYDELSSLPQAAFWSLILAPIFLALVIIAHRREVT